MILRFKSRSYLLIILSLVSFLGISPIHVSPFRMFDKSLQAAAWQSANPESESAWSKSDQLIMDGETVQIISPSGNWISPPNWQVKQAAWSDLNHDSQLELTILVRRPHEPWPVDKVLPHGGRIDTHQDIQGMSSHIILIGWKEDHWGEIWAGSALARPVQKFAINDLNQDEKQELIVMEGAYNKGYQLSAESLALWTWNGFGFDLLSRLEQPLNNFIILKSDQDQAILLVDQPHPWFY